MSNSKNNGNQIEEGGICPDSSGLQCDNISSYEIRFFYRVAENFFAGEYPLAEGKAKLQKILDFGIIHFIDLTMEPLTIYKDFLPDFCTYTQLATEDYTVPTFENLKKAHDFICKSKEKVYLHCLGGYDRTGIAVATYFIYCGLTVEQAKEQFRVVSKPVLGRYNDPPLIEENWMVLNEYEQFLMKNNTGSKD